MKGDKVKIHDAFSDEYHCNCRFCKKVIGELLPGDGTFYSRLERRKYYSPDETGPTGHVAKTPLHVARWAVQAYTRKGDWVLDPTMGAGTTAVEALTQGRNAAGMELEFGEILKANIALNKTLGTNAAIRLGDARKIGDFLKHVDQKFSLVVNNPPYSGDEHMSTHGKDPVTGMRRVTHNYTSGLPNLAFLKEGKEYWETIDSIYGSCIQYLKPGGRFVVAVKDMMRKKQPFLLHLTLAEHLEALGLEHEGTAILRHWPTTQFLNTYFKIYGIHPPYFQTILVFRKKGGRR